MSPSQQRGASECKRMVSINSARNLPEPVSNEFASGSIRCRKIITVSVHAGVKVFAGSENHGIYVNLPDRGDEEYNVTHPTAAITGFLRGSPYITISDHCYVTCLSPNGQSQPGTKAYRAIISFPDEVSSPVCP